MNGIIITISGTSGIGKGYLKDHLREHFGLAEPPVYTTRKRRKGENRKDRVFLTDAEFEKMQRDGQLILKQDLFGDKYAFGKESFTKGEIITEIHPIVAQQFRREFPQAIMIALTTDSLDFLESRLKKRGDDPKEAKKRLLEAENEIKKTMGLKSVFNINFSVGRHNEDRIVSDIIQKVERVIRTRKTKYLLQRKRKLRQKKDKKTVKKRRVK